MRYIIYCLAFLSNFSLQAPTIQTLGDHAMQLRSSSAAPGDVSMDTTSLFNFLITDPVGQDASSRLTILHHHHESSPPSQHQKRVTSRRMDTCPPGHEWTGDSFCTRHYPFLSAANAGPQGVTIICGYTNEHGNGQYYTFHTACLEHEVCVDRNRASFQHLDQHPHEAYCVSKSNFVKIAQDQWSHVTAPANLQAPVHAVPGTQFSVEALLTSLDSRQMVTAASLEINGERSQIVQGRPLWLGVSGGMRQCGNCATVEIETMPVETQRVSVSFGLRAGTEAGLLYLVSF